MSVILTLPAASDCARDSSIVRMSTDRRARPIKPLRGNLTSLRKICSIWPRSLGRKRITSDCFIPRTAPTAQKLKPAGLDELPKVQLQGVPVYLRNRQCRRQSETSMLARQLEQLLVEKGKDRKSVV